MAGSLARKTALTALFGVALSLGCEKLSSRKHAPNLLLITIDTVRADHVGAYGDRDAETPNLDRLARRGLRFDQAISAVPLTLPSHATILSGMLPPHHGLRNNGAGRFPAARETLATHFSAGGYRTGAFVGAYVLDHRFGLNRGFETYDDDIARDPASPTALEAERPGREVVDRAIAWLDRRDARPFFAWVHLYDAHAPYDPPEPYRSRHRDHLYDGEIASVDAQVGRLLDWLSQNGDDARTIVAVAADHGEALGEHGELTHGFLLYEPTLRVPLIIRAPGIAAGPRRVATPVSLADLAPTVAGLAGRPFSNGGLDGRDLSEFLRRGGEPAEADLYSESEYPRVFGWSGLSALRRKNLKYIEAPKPELYDLSRDAKEADNMIAANGRRADLSARIASFRRDARTPDAPGGDRESAAKLAALGYISGGPARATSGGEAKDPKEMVAAFRRFEEAHWATVAGRLPEARALLQTLVAEDPRNPIFLDSLAQAFRKSRDYPAAIAWYRKAVAAAPEDPDYRYDLAVTLQEAGRETESLSTIEDAIRRDGSRPESHNALGIALWAQGRPIEALAEFDRAASLDPLDARAQNNRGNVLRELKRPDEAEAAYRKAISLAPRYADPWNGLGTLEVEQKRFADAVASFGRTIMLAPEDHEARLNRGIALEMAGDLPSAASAYRDFLAAARGDPRFARQRQVASELIARLARKESESPQPERR